MQMTYPDDVLKAAREAAAKYWETVEGAGWSMPMAARDGLLDKTAEVQAACIAIMAERQRCAGIAAAIAKGLCNAGEKLASTGDVPIGVRPAANIALEIAGIILGQRER